MVNLRIRVLWNESSVLGVQPMFCNNSVNVLGILKMFHEHVECLSDVLLVHHMCSVMFQNTRNNNDYTISNIMSVQ